MYKLIEYISDLLFLHDCVIIPDFGGFICNHRSASIDPDHGTICPPTKDILFNRNLVHNDGLLIHWIASKEDISYEKAATQLALFCEELKIKLNQNEKVVFGEIGVFYTDRRFNVIFEPNRNNFLSESFGMEPIHLPQQKQPTIEASSLHPRKSNRLYRFITYGVSAAAIAGIAFITQTDIFPRNQWRIKSIANQTTVQPSFFFSSSMPVTCNSVISPEQDYIDYDPFNDLNR